MYLWEEVANMKHRIALMSDVHGNVTALQAVVEDSIKEGVTDYWLLGDLIMPGPGANDIFQILDRIHVDTYVRGNWEDCFFDVLNQNLDFQSSTEIYVTRLAQYLCEKLDAKYMNRMKELPLHLTKKINNLNISISHNLPNKNCGGDLWPTNNQEKFDQLFEEEYDIAIYGHTHQQLLRYSSNGQMIINPGSIGQPFLKWKNLHSDLRAQYAILEIDESGVAEVRFKKVSYNVEKELENARQNKLPYFVLYKELLETGIIHTHDTELLQKINDQKHYREETIHFFEENYWG